MLIMRMFDVIKMSLNKNELRYLMKKLRLTDDKISELEQTYQGKDKLHDRIYNTLLHWRELHGPEATIDTLIHVFHLIGYNNVTQKLRSMKLLSQRLRF